MAALKCTGALRTQLEHFGTAYGFEFGGAVATATHGIRKTQISIVSVQFTSVTLRGTTLRGPLRCAFWGSLWSCTAVAKGTPGSWRGAGDNNFDWQGPWGSDRT